MERNIKDVNCSNPINYSQFFTSPIYTDRQLCQVKHWNNHIFNYLYSLILEIWDE